MNAEAYSTYKKSGVEWLGEVPDHWQVLPTKRFFGLVAEPAPDDNDHELLSIYTDIGVRPRKDLEARGNRASTTDGYWMVKKGDLIVNKLLAWMGAIGMSEYDGVTSPAYDILRQTKPLDPKFYHYLFRCGICFTEFRKYSRGIMDMRLRLYFDQLGQLPMPFPPLDEQKAISSFLDVETSKIDGLVSEQRRLIELLKEKRQAVISHAVTKGLNPNAPMKPSGIQWLGNVPQHWTVTPIKNLCYVNDGNHGEEYPKDGDSASKEDGVPFIRAGDFENFTIVEDDLRYISREKNDSMRKGNLQENDILFVNRGATIGKVGVIDSNYVGANLNSQIAYLRVNESNFSHRFLMYYLSGTFIQETVVATVMGGALPQYPIKHIVNLDVCHPDLDEQREVAAHLDSVTETLDSLVAEAERAIELLQERRTALISAAVTGKIDVREFAWQDIATEEIAR